jgi:hypothetical protein
MDEGVVRIFISNERIIEMRQSIVDPGVKAVYFDDDDKNQRRNESF